MFVLGAGSLGCLWAAHLAKVVPTRLLLRPDSPKLTHLTAGVAHLRVQQTETWEVQLPSEAVNSTGDIQQLLLVTKATAAAEALSQVAPRLVPGSVLVLLCNGALAVHDEIKKMPNLKESHVILGLTTHGAWSKAPFHVVHAGVGRTCFGKATGNEDEAIFQSTLTTLQSAGLGGERDDEIQRSLWLKLAANACINPITALLEAPNGIMEAKEETCQKICEEVALVAEAINGSSAPSAFEMASFTKETVRQTAKNQSSMLQDVLAERPTEIDYINGWIVSRAASLGIDTPENRNLAELIRSKERRKSKRKELIRIVHIGNRLKIFENSFTYRTN